MSLSRILTRICAHSSYDNTYGVLLIPGAADTCAHVLAVRTRAVLRPHFKTVWEYREEERQPGRNQSQLEEYE